MKGILILLGVFLIVFGLWRLLAPISFFEYSGLTLSEDPGLLNEARATGGFVTGFGILILLGAFMKKLTFTSTITATVLFFGFGIGRVIGYALDGNPGEALLKGIIGEFVFGLLALFALLKYRESNKSIAQM